LEEKRVMPIKRYKPEQIVTMLRQIEVGIANGKTTCRHSTTLAPACRAFIKVIQSELARRTQGPAKAH
jgi:hypothetical protein